MFTEKFLCGNCAWYKKIEIPEEKKEAISPRGFCQFYPPSVMPMPQAKQKSSLALAQGHEPPGEVMFVPIMNRPVVEADEIVCSKYNPGEEMVKKIEEYKDKMAAEGCCEGNDGCGGCQDEGAKCACKE